MEENIDKYIDWVVNKIEYLQEATKSLKKTDVSIHDLKEILSNRLHVSLTLNSEYQRFKVLHSGLLIDYNIFWDEKFTLVKRELNPNSLASGKFSSKSEIESETRYTYKDEYLKFKKELVRLENRTAYLRRLMDQWEKVSFDVSNYIKLIEIEVYSLSNMESAIKPKTRVRERSQY